MRRARLSMPLASRCFGLSELGDLRVGWPPAADVYRDRHGGWVVKFELAGVRREDVSLGVVGRALTIRGKRCDWCVTEAREAYSMEIVYSRFERTLELPCDVEGAHLSTDYRDGLFFVRLRTVVTER